MLPLITSIPFLHAFGFFHASLPLIICTLVLVYLIFSKQSKLTLHFSSTDWLLLLPLIIGMFALDYSNIQTKQFNHLILWVVTVILFYFGTKLIVVNSKFSLNDLGGAFLLALLIASLGVTVDFVAINFYGFYLSDVLPYQMNEMEETKNFGGSLFRARGFAAEPGFTAMVYEFLLPLGLFYCVNHRQYLILMPFILFSYLILTSAASLGGFFVLFSLFCLGSLRKIFFAIVWISVAGFLFWEQIYFYLDQSIGPKILIIMNGESIRVQILESFLKVLFDNPFGLGFGTISYAFENGGFLGNHRLPGGGAINLYLEIALISGVIGLVSFLAFLVSVFYRSIKLGNRPELIALRCSLAWILIHQFFLTEYYFPMLWVNLALIVTFGYVESRSPPNFTASRF